jgi:hypothetical protein
MLNIFNGVCWAGAILLNAAGNYLGLIDDVTARTLFIVLPIMAVTSLRGGRKCRWPFQETQA